ncbi:ATP phosphoribosyltransferase regulatory subunit [Staphylospora marina]|uniref:ATP phosphoribosyltransferase regulatory subunit n=1 Tax=Staphylospora marina TaxID=2490858 RepID=UPI000F5BC73B|nr:ATP phosphoribosyltransferase regulatory subunit [Staphylospora marina]
MRPEMFEKPVGFRDYPPAWIARKRWLERNVEERFRLWGYREIATPSLEFLDTVGEASAIDESRMFKCMDRDGRTLVLRPDQTTPIARMVCSSLKHEPLPLRLYYHAGVFRAQEREAGRDAEFFQSGVELVGASGPEADAEVILLAMEALNACGLDAFRIVLGHVGLLDAWLREAAGDSGSSVLKKRLVRRDWAGFLQALGREVPSASKRERLLAVLRPAEGEEVDRRLRELSAAPEAAGAAADLGTLWNHLRTAGDADRLVFDPCLTGSLGYYTGVYFEGYAEGNGFPLLGGGRYDGLYVRFGRELPATGFALKTDRVMEVSPLVSDEPTRVSVRFSPEMWGEACREARLLRERGSVAVLRPDPSLAEGTVLVTKAGEEESA